MKTDFSKPDDAPVNDLPRPHSYIFRPLGASKDASRIAWLYRGSKETNPHPWAACIEECSESVPGIVMHKPREWDLDSYLARWWNARRPKPKTDVTKP